jgi:hypothetical protein
MSGTCEMTAGKYTLIAAASWTASLLRLAGHSNPVAVDLAESRSDQGLMVTAGGCCVLAGGH